MGSSFDRGRFSAALTTRRLGRTLVARASTGSTNDEAWEALAAGAPDGTVVVADAQTRGRGRGGRAWHTAPGKALALSVLLRGDRAPGGLALLPLAAGLAVARGLERLGARATLKWPNDVLLAGRKVAGVLCESRRAAAGPGAAPGDAAVVGVGVNVAQAGADFPPDIAATATSLAAEGVVTDREAVAAAILDALEPLWAALGSGAGADVLGDWSARAPWWGRPVAVRTPAGEVRGVARALAPDGALVLALPDGRETLVRAGDVELPPGSAPR